MFAVFGYVRLNPRFPPDGGIGATLGQSDSQSDKQSDSQTVSQSDSPTVSQTVIQSYSQTVRQSGSQTVRQSHRQTVSQTDSGRDGYLLFNLTRQRTKFTSTSFLDLLEKKIGNHNLNEI